MNWTLWPIFFSSYRTRKMSGTIFIRFHMVFDNFRANDKILSFRHKKSIETNVSKNSRFKDEIKIWPIFPRMIECDDPEGTIYKSPQAIFTITV